MAKVKVDLKDIPKCTPEMIAELKRRAQIPNPNRQYPELPEWRTFEVSIDQFVQEHNVEPQFDEGGREYDPPGPQPFDQEYHESKGTNREAEVNGPECTGSDQC